MQDFRRKFGKATMELVGTFILLFTIQLAMSSAGKMAPVSIGLALMAAVYAGGPISGAQLGIQYVWTPGRTLINYKFTAM